MLCDSEIFNKLPLGPRPELNYRTVTGKLKSIWESHPDKETLIFFDDDNERTSLKNEEIQLLAQKCSSLLRSHGVRKGDVVCNLLQSSLEREVTNFGIILAGAIVMHGDVINDTSHHFWTPILQANARYLIVEPVAESTGWKMLMDDIEPSGADIERSTNAEYPQIQKVFKFRLEHHIKDVNRESVKSAFDLMKAHPGVYEERVFSHDPAAIFVAQGSQKHYKLVLRNHSQLCQIAHRVEDMFNVTPEDVVYNDWPISWLAGLPFCYISTGCSMVKSTLTECPAQKVVRETWSLIEDEHVTIASLHPPMIQMLSSHCDDLPEPHWKLKVLSTTGFVRQSVMDAIGTCTTSIVTCYSLIEAGVVSRLRLTEENKTRFSEGCVGDLSDPVRTKFDTEGNGSAKATKVGEILLQGKLVCKEYFNDPNLTKMSFTNDGFLMTGDLGFYNEENQLFVLGRKVDAIIRGGTAIFPRDIEEKVNQCPGIWKVKVVSIKDYKGIVQMCACVIPRTDDSLTIERVKEFCRYQLGGTYDADDNPHMPTYVFFFEEFPMHKGTVNRRMLAYMASEIVHGNANCEY
ncbi:acyl-CoA synthetase YngI [Biomphalaria pfeifferi]|uniref:Medium-chain acyl-CoA ligase ACSF2, mitochondrial n=1 Tax=Biomphalaria pfeifferi TaxID=112525 RepID=A0AAD8F669_BIOPF|nr:acyl-CoA synthetase YngI [Biomphalaria pfeifferi]